MNVAKAAKKLTKREARQLGEPGAFALHLASLLADKGWDHQKLAEECQRAGMDVKEWQVRSWLRADHMPKAAMLRPLAKVLGLSDSRHILPE